MNSNIDLKALIDQFGPPAYQNKKGDLSRLNDNFWAAYYARNREQIIYEPCEREFYDYDASSGIFVPKTPDRIRTELSALVLDAARNWDGWSGMNVFRNAANLSGTITHLRGFVEERDFFNQPEHFVHLGDCALKFAPDGSKFSVENFSPAHRSRNRSPITYDPKAKCPLFQNHVLGHVAQDDKILLQKYAGQCLLGRNITQRFGILDGVGGSSKGAFVLTLAGIVGPANIYELRTEHLGERFEIGRMIGRTLLLGADVRYDFMSRGGAHKIKSLVGGDALEAELKGSNLKFLICGNFNLIITSNVRLLIRIKEDRSAWERRLWIIRYEKPFNGTRIPEIHQMLLGKEASGILNWALEGLSLLLHDISLTGDIILSAEQKNRVSSLLSESDSLRLFVKNDVLKTTAFMANNQKYSLTTEEILTEYVKDCVEDKHWIPVPWATAEKMLPDLMLQFHGISKSHDLQRKGKAQRGYWNVRF